MPSATAACDSWAYSGLTTRHVAWTSLPRYWRGLVLLCSACALRYQHVQLYLQADSALACLVEGMTCPGDDNAHIQTPQCTRVENLVQHLGPDTAIRLWGHYNTSNMHVCVHMLCQQQQAAAVAPGAAVCAVPFWHRSCCAISFYRLSFNTMLSPLIRCMRIQLMRCQQLPFMRNFECVDHVEYGRNQICCLCAFGVHRW